jgi:hypothetical protein
MRIRVDWSVKIGDILTSLTILVSVVALLISWSKDRITRETEQADRIRAAAANAVTKLDRWQALELSFYQELQPVFVETSEALRDNYDVVKVRDQLWKSINAERTKIASKVLEEQIQTAYADLLSHFPAARAKFVDAFAKLSETEDHVTTKFLADTERDVLDFEGRQKRYVTAMLGNALRATAVKRKNELRESTTQLIQPVREYLFGVIAKTDTEILLRFT